jgi:hypothetical protein
MENFYFQCDDKAWFRVRIRICTETYADPKTPVSQLHLKTWHKAKHISSPK